MANTAPNPYELPGDYAGAGAEVLDQAASSHGGPYYTGTAANAMCRNYRGTLAHDGKASAVGSSGSPVPDSLAPVLYDASQVSEYKPRILGFSSLTERVVVRFYVNCIKNISGAGTLRFDCLIGSTAATATVTISDTTVGWVTLLVAGQNPIIADDQETEEFTASFTVVSGPWDQTRVEVVHIYYPISAVALPVPTAGDDGYQPSGVVPLDADQFQGERPRSTSSLHHLFRNLDYLDRERVGNVLGAGNMSIGTTLQDATILDARPPADVVSLRVWVKTTLNATTTVAVIGGSGASASAATNSVTWTSIDVAVLPDVPVHLLISTDSTTKYLKSVSGYWEDR
jgi:hypothetical protein